MEHQVLPECEHRMTEMETIIKNHLPHLEKDIQTIKKILWTVVGSICTGFIGLVFFLIKGHITFK